MNYYENNTGEWNIGDFNIGNCNTGEWNIGDFNIGNCNIGDYNIGNCNAGNWNVSDYNTGYCNTITFTSGYMFNKLVDNIHNVVFPGWMYFTIEPDFKSELTSAQKIERFQLAAKKAWNKASQEEKEQTFNLPNFDADIFYEIFGIDVRKKYNTLSNDDVMIINGIKYKKVID